MLRLRTFRGVWCTLLNRIPVQVLVILFVLDEALRVVGDTKASTNTRTGSFNPEERDTNENLSFVTEPNVHQTEDGKKNDNIKLMKYSNLSSPRSENISNLAEHSGSSPGVGAQQQRDPRWLSFPSPSPHVAQPPFSAFTWTSSSTLPPLNPMDFILRNRQDRRPPSRKSDRRGRPAKDSKKKKPSNVVFMVPSTRPVQTQECFSSNGIGAFTLLNVLMASSNMVTNILNNNRNNNNNDNNNNNNDNNINTSNNNNNANNVNNIDFGRRKRTTKSQQEREEEEEKTYALILALDLARRLWNDTDNKDGNAQVKGGNGVKESRKEYRDANGVGDTDNRNGNAQAKGGNGLKASREEHRDANGVDDSYGKIFRNHTIEHSGLKSSRSYWSEAEERVQESKEKQSLGFENGGKVKTENDGNQNGEMEVLGLSSHSNKKDKFYRKPPSKISSPLRRSRNKNSSSFSSLKTNGYSAFSSRQRSQTLPEFHELSPLESEVKTNRPAVNISPGKHINITSQEGKHHPSFTTKPTPHSSLSSPTGNSNNVGHGELTLSVLCPLFRKAELVGDVTMMTFEVMAKQVLEFVSGDTWGSLDLAQRCSGF